MLVTELHSSNGIPRMLVMELHCSNGITRMLVTELHSSSLKILQKCWLRNYIAVQPIRICILNFLYFVIQMHDRKYFIFQIYFQYCIYTLYFKYSSRYMYLYFVFQIQIVFEIQSTNAVLEIYAY